MVAMETQQTGNPKLLSCHILSGTDGGRYKEKDESGWKRGRLEV